MKKSFKIKLFSIIIASLAVVGGIIGMCVAYFVNPLVEIYVKELPTNTEYFEAEQFDQSGLKVVAKYKYYNIEKEIENFEIIVDDPLTDNTKFVTISYSENSITKTVSFEILVKQRKISEMIILSQPLKTVYYEGEFFDVNGLKLQVNCENGAKSFEPNNIKINLENIALTQDDKNVVISYSEHERTVFVVVDIVVKELTTQQEQMQVAENLIGFLPDYDDVEIEDESTIEYIKNKYDNLTQEQKQEINADELLTSLIIKVEQLKREQELILNKEYKITYIPKLETTDFTSNNITTYKNAMGNITLNDPNSDKLFNEGYDFAYWENQDGVKVTQINDISEDVSYYAVYNLSSLININFMNFDDDSEIGAISVKRYNGTSFQYNLINNEINNFIFDKVNQIPTDFYLTKTSNPVITLSTTQGRTLNVFVKLLSLSDLIDKNLPEQQANSVTFVFGDNVKEFALQDGYLQQGAISDIYAYYNEENENYLNYYLIGGIRKTYQDLKDFDFSNLENNVVVVSKVENSFTLTLDYNDGNKIFSGLKGKQSLQKALIEYAGYDENTLIFIEGLGDYFDLSQTLYGDLLLKMSERIPFEIILHNGTETNTISISDENLENLQLSEYLPKLQKLGYIFKGWALSETDDVLTDEYINLIIQNKNKNCELFAVWQINPNYDFPASSVNYKESFVGNWQATFNYDNKIIELNLVLYADGIYNYAIKCNGVINSTIMGEYRFEDNHLKIYSLALDGDYQIIEKNELSFDINYIDSNILVATCFYIEYSESSIQFESFDAILSNGNIKFANYYGQKFLGKYQFIEKDLLTNVSSLYIIELLSNGNAIILVDNKTYNVTYRVIENKIIILSNDIFGVKDLTKYITEQNRF